VTHLVSSLPVPTLHRMLQNSTLPITLPISNASSVSVVTLIFPPTPQPIHPPGFGYLIPRPEAGYEGAKSGILGVVFDSCSLSAQDEGDPGFTKMTIMMGGPYPAATRNTPIEQVLATVGKQLGVTLPEPVHVSRHEQADCIPVPGPGHTYRVEEMRKTLREKWEGKLDIIGAGIGGVSVSDCVRQGREAGRHWT
jgi:oxygen-dependent protoporphyrinogen oxidase